MNISGTPTDLTDKIYSINPPDYKRDPYICVINSNGQKACYKDDRYNTILCDNNNCKVNYRTYDQTVLKKDIPESLWVNMLDQGAFAGIQIIGVIPRIEIQKFQDTIGSIPISNVSEIKEPFFGIPKKPKKCSILPFLKDCKI